jgi:NAD+ synthase (glutamine-hydrolysing)
VNASITKTALRALVRHVAEERLIASYTDALSGLITSILETPVSPELLPAGEDGEPGQKTEEILAPYELLDFFLYYFIKYRFSPSKLLLYACAAFGGKYEPKYIKEKLRLFIERFYAAQFKRSCSPDAAALTEVNLAGFYMPSDLDPSGLLAELDNTDINNN